MESGRFRVLLQDLHSDLPDEDVKCLKFLVQPIIKKRLYDNIKDGLGFFEALEDCNMLSSGNLTFLSELLETIRRLDLHSMIANQVVYSDAVSGEHLLVCPFRKLLFNLHKDIIDEDLKRMRFLCSNVPKRATINDPLDLFSFMMREECLAPNNLGFLKQLFTEISRLDLCQEVIKFEDDVSPQDCSYLNRPNQASPIVFQTAASDNSISSMFVSEPGLEDLKEGASHQEWGHSEQEQMIPPVFHTASVHSSSSFPSMSTYSQPYKDDADFDNSMDTNMCHPNSSSGNDKATTAPDSGQGAAAAAAIDPQPTFFDLMNSIDKSDCYKMDAEPRGLCLIIDVQTFTKDPNDPRAKALTFRGGSQIDRENLKTTFKLLRFEVYDKINPTDHQIRQILREYASRNHRAYDCFVLCILSHGVGNCFYGSNGRGVEGSELLDIFSAKNCPTLADKPKLFFFAHCRGEHYRPAVTLTTEDVIEMDSPIPEPNNTMSNEVDFLFAYATTLNSVSYRSPSKGTFYIETLTQVFQQCAHKMELQHLLLKVHKQVSQKYFSNGAVFRQSPDTHHTLKDRVYFL